MRAIGDMASYMQYQSAQAMRDAARTPGSGAGEGMGLGMGFGMGQMMAQQMANIQPQSQQAAPPSQPSPEERLKKLESLKAAGLITEAEYAQKRAKIIEEL